jgi:GDPmannose 4,6-dehydratase
VERSPPSFDKGDAMKSALVIGASGQDGSYLCEYLLTLGYEVFGLVRRSTREALIIPGVKYVIGDVLDGNSITEALQDSVPDEVYNLAADSFVGSSWAQPMEQAEVTGLGCLRILEAIRKIDRKIKFYQASTSELYGNAPSPQNEDTPFHPRSPYGCAKLYAHSITVNYRESYGIFACCGILFNHESARRGAEFVTQKIATQAAEVKAGKREQIELGSLDAKRDWGYAPEYVAAMHLMLQQYEPADYVVATGVTHTIREFLQTILTRAGLSKDCLRVKIDNMRPAETWELRGDASKIRALGWAPIVGMEELAEIMYDAAMERVK